jgi:glutamate synthase (NADPH/NADH) small chain
MPKVPIKEQNPKKRIKNFNEVCLGYTEEEAVKEAERCLQCKKKPCVDGCPVEIDIPAFIELVKEGKFLEAARKVKEKNLLPAICGRVCPQETQCEGECTLGKKDEPVAIGKLERFVADYERENNLVEVPKVEKDKKIKVAVVGSGPAGLTVAGDLARQGYRVTIFEALHESGGVLMYGIPEFRLPKKVVRAEIELLEKMGVKILTNCVVGKTYSLDDIFAQGYKAIFLGIGAGLPIFMRIEGENLNGVYSANEFLTRVNLMRAYLFPEFDTPIKKGKKVAVIGGGNVALDAARSALRLGAEKVYLVYRRTEKEMPARVEEYEHAKEEGIDFRFLTLPTRILGENGWVKGMECIKMKLGEPDETGRRRPIPIEGSEFELEVDKVVVAIGTRANPLLLSATRGLRLNERGYIKVNKKARTSKKGVFAGGDIVTGAATVISAMGMGRLAAHSIDEYLS